MTISGLLLVHRSTGLKDGLQDIELTAVLAGLVPAHRTIPTTPTEFPPATAASNPSCRSETFRKGNVAFLIPMFLLCADRDQE